MRVFHGDDSESYRHLIREVLDDGEIEIVGGAGTPEGVVEGVEREKPDVILLDQFGGAPLIESIRSSCPDAKVIVLSGYESANPYVAAAREALDALVMASTAPTAP